LTLDVQPEVLISVEVAHFIYMQNQRLTATAGSQHSVAAISSAVMSRYFTSALDLSADGVREVIASMIGRLRRKLAENMSPDQASDLYELLSEPDQEAFARNLLASGRALTDATSVVRSGEFIDLVEPTALVGLCKARPELLSESLATSSVDGGGIAIAASVAQRLAGDVIRGLEDCANFLDAVNPAGSLTKRTKASLEYVNAQLDL
jgi:hypothetical protein